MRHPLLIHQFHVTTLSTYNEGILVLLFQVKCQLFFRRVSLSLSSVLPFFPSSSASGFFFQSMLFLQGFPF